MNARSRIALAVKTLCASTLVTGAMLGAGISTAYGQSVSAGPDRPLNRVCTNGCVQANETIAVDGAGNALAIWEERVSSTTTYITAARYNATTNSWSASRRLGLGKKPAIDVDGGGNAIAVWDGGIPEGRFEYHDVVYARFLAAQGSWTSPRVFTSMPSFLLEQVPTLQVAKTGDALLQLNANGNSAELLRFDAPTSTWLGIDYYVPDALIDFNDAGNAVLANVYPIERNSTETNILVSRYDNGADDARTAQILDRSPVSNTSLKLLGATKDSLGNETVFWQKTTTSSTGAVTRYIRSARYIASKNTWLYKTVSELNNNAVINADVDADRFGNVHAVWTQYVGAYIKTVSARYSSSTGAWSAPKVISAGSYHTRDASLDADNNGNVIATWSQRTDTGTGSAVGKVFRTTAARYAQSSNTWGTPLTIQDANRNSYKPFMGVSDSGRAVVLWNQDSTTAGVKELRADRVLPY